MKPTTALAALLLAAIATLPQAGALVVPKTNPDNAIKSSDDPVPACEATDGLATAMMMPLDSQIQRACEPRIVEVGPDTPSPQGGGDVASSGPSCSKSGDDKGFGGTHISCKYSCPQHAELVLAVKATDAGASTYGDTECGAQAHCAESTPACADASKGLTNSRQEDARCNGNTDEFWDSPATVACSAVGADPCLLIKDLCEDQSFATALRDVCADSNPGIDPGVLDSLPANHKSFGDVGIPKTPTWRPEDRVASTASIRCIRSRGRPLTRFHLVGDCWPILGGT